MSEVLEAARELTRAGLSVIPVARFSDKRPAIKWSTYQDRPPTDDELRAWFEVGAYGIGVVCGAVSGGLVVFDFETLPAFDKWAARVNEAAGGCLDRLPIAATPGGGRHVYVRTTGKAPAGAKLAFRRGAGGDLELIGETRGEGHYVIAPGSPADVHPSGVPYKWLRKGWLNG